MPFIQINSFKSDRDIGEVLALVSKDIAAATAFTEDRLILVWNPWERSVMLRKGAVVCGLSDANSEIVVSLTLSARNDKKSVAQLVETVADSLARHLDFDKDRISLLVDYLEQGQLFVNGQFI